MPGLCGQLSAHFMRGCRRAPLVVHPTPIGSGSLCKIAHSIKKLARIRPANRLTWDALWRQGCDPVISNACRKRRARSNAPARLLSGLRPLARGAYSFGGAGCDTLFDLTRNERPPGSNITSRSDAGKSLTSQSVVDAVGAQFVDLRRIGAVVEHANQQLEPMTLDRAPGCALGCRRPQAAAARLLGIDDRTSRRWAQYGIHGISETLRLLLTGRITPADIHYARRHRST
jgi:hypothetical protein